MGGDYYLITELEIKYKYNDRIYTTEIQLKREGYYFRDYNGDSDDENYELKRDKHYENQLKINGYEKIDIEIYKNSNYVNKNLQTKYESIIHEKIIENLNIYNYINKYEDYTYTLISVIKSKYKLENF